MANISRIADTALFGILIVALFCLIIISPVDSIYQCYRTHRLTNIFFIAGAYIITFLLAVFIYSSRIYTNRTVLASIPKAWIPIEREDVGANVRRLVVDGLSRSAIVAYEARPRDLSSDEAKVLVDPDRPPWGTVEHPGWSSPSCAVRDLSANIHYRDVVLEIPYLIEAKAVSLAPSPEEEKLPDTRVVQVLQRPASMGLREYIEHLMSLDLINPPELAGEFLAMYSWARFSTCDLYEVEFRQLMHVFAEILRGMRSISREMVDEIHRGSSGYSYPDGGSSHQESFILSDSDDSSSLVRGRQSFNDNDSTKGRRRHATPSPAAYSLRAPVAQRASSRHSSLSALRPVRSNVSRSSAGSVIRLVDNPGPTDLPYVISRSEGLSHHSNG